MRQPCATTMCWATLLAPSMIVTNPYFNARNATESAANSSRLSVVARTSRTSASNRSRSRSTRSPSTMEQSCSQLLAARLVALS